MGALTIEHNGRELAFREDDETWSCHGMNMQAKSLRALRAKLDKFDGQARRVSATVIVLDHYDTKISSGDIVMIAKPKDWETVDYSTRERAPSVWINQVKGNQTERKKVRLDRCILPTDENRLVLESAAEKMATAKAIQADAKAMIEAIPRLSIKDLLSRDIVEDNIDD